MANNELKVGIVSGIVSSLLVILLIQPTLRIVWEAVLRLGNLFHQGYVDRIYRNAALDRDIAAHLVVMIIILAILLRVFYLMVVFHQQESTGGPNRRLPAMPKFNLFPKMFNFGLAGVAFLVVFVAASISNGTMEISASFTQRLTVLAPAISDIEYKNFRARWANMHGKADYDALVSAMDRRAAEVGITLPALREP
jgi:hypothetical protein